VLQIAVVGATGLVGRELLKLLEEAPFPIGRVMASASSRSVGEIIAFGNEKLEVQPLDILHMAGVQLAFFAIGEDVSRTWVPKLSEEGVKIIDKSNAFRLSEGVPLVVSGVNDDAIEHDSKVVANPNCSTIQLAIPLSVLAREFGLSRVVVSTYQSVSGAGSGLVDQLKRQVEHFETELRLNMAELPPDEVAFNVLPRIGPIADDGFSEEENKLIRETRKILGLPHLPISASAARVPVYFGHTEAVTVDLDTHASLADVQRALQSTPYIRYFLNDTKTLRPTPVHSSRPDYDFVDVGRLRVDPVFDNGFSFFVCANNVRVGAALNAVRIATYMYTQGYLG
jgi:aspartate-semialdehyde dehydrogenase